MFKYANEAWLFQRHLVILVENKYHLLLTQSSYPYRIISGAQYHTDSLCTSQSPIYREMVRQD